MWLAGGGGGARGGGGGGGSRGSASQCAARSQQQEPGVEVEESRIESWEVSGEWVGVREELGAPPSSQQQQQQQQQQQLPAPASHEPHEPHAGGWNLRVVFCLGAPTSLASTMAVGPHHTAVLTYTPIRAAPREAPKWASGSTWLGKVSQGKCWSEFLCLGGYLPPPRQVGGRVPREHALGRHPSAAPPRRWRPAGGPVAGAGLAVFPPTASVI
jgi:hypothetical protein